MNQTTCACGKPGSVRQLEHDGQPYAIEDPCDECATANRHRLDLLTAGGPSYEALTERLLREPS